MNRNIFHLMESAMIFATVLSGCQSSKKIVSTTTPSTEKPKTEQRDQLHREEALNRKAFEQNLNRETESALKVMTESAPKFRLNEYFEAIAGASNSTVANSNIADALKMFASTNTPVYIVGGEGDYDHPTTIAAYLNYVKDLKKNDNDIAHLKMNVEGKITEVQLRKIN